MPDHIHIQWNPAKNTITNNMTRTATLLIALFLLVPSLLVPSLAFGQQTIVVTDDDVTGEVTWTSDNVYILNGRVFAEEGTVLTIEPGTVIKARYSADPENASVLVIAPGAKIYAEGTPEAPIIFTAEDDDLDDPYDLDETDRALWGGVIILGRAGLNVAGGQEQIEGIPASDTRGMYGGDDDDDDSGVFRYVSIRHGGASIAPNNEINGLTMGGVGRGTTIEYVEVFANLDDCFEWFGGTVDTRYLVGAFCGDDTFDYDEGYRGNGQFWFGIQSPDEAGTGGEFDGGTTPEDGTPYAIPTIYNVTLIGSGAESGLASNDFAMNIRDNAGGKFYNSIFTDFAGRAVQVEDLPSGEDTWARLLADELVISHSIFYGFGGGTTPDELFVVAGQEETSPLFVDYITAEAQNNLLVDPQLRSISRFADGGLDPRPAAGSPALASATYPADDDFFVQTDYLGAFDGEDLWIEGWTGLSTLGYLSEDGGVSNEPGFNGSGFEIERNYPNPFSRSTTIAYEVDAPQHVRLAVYDVTGREVAVLVDEAVAAGRHEVGFSATALPSGIYIYRLQGNQRTAAGTMTLVR